MGGLAVIGNQPALQVHVKATEDEKVKVARSIVQQKVGSNPKAMKSYDELQARKQENKQQREQAGRNHIHEGEDTDKILLKVARIAAGCKVRWARSTNKLGDGEAPEEAQDGS